MTNHEQNQEHEAQVELASTDEPQESGRELKLGDEFRTFGRQLMRALRSVADGEELRQLSNEVVETLRDLGEEVQNTVERTRQKEEIRAVSEQAKRVGQAVSSGIPARDVASELQSGLGQALRTLNEELNKLIDQVQARSARTGEEVEGTAREAAPNLEGGTVEDVTGDGQITAEDMRAESGSGEETGMGQEAQEPVGTGDSRGVDNNPGNDAGGEEGSGFEPQPIAAEAAVGGATGASDSDNEGGIATADNVDDDEPRDDRPEYLGDKVDEAVHRLEENGGPMSDEAESLLAEGRAELDALMDEPGQEDEEQGER